MLGVFPDVPFFIKAGDHKSLAITRYLAFSLFSENVSKERIHSFLFHRFYSISLLFQQIQDSVSSRQVACTNNKEGGSILHESRHFFNPCFVTVIQQGFHFARLRSHELPSRSSISFQHFIQVLSLVCIVETFSLFHSFIYVTYEAIE